MYVRRPFAAAALTEPSANQPAVIYAAEHPALGLYPPFTDGPVRVWTSGFYLSSLYADKTIRHHLTNRSPLVAPWLDRRSGQ